jgi:uncharacterized protein (TIGR03435 family)
MTQAAAAILLTGILAAQVKPGEEKLEFEVASVKLNKSVDQPSRSNVPLGPGAVFSPVKGVFTATNWPLATYIAFAYKILGNQQQALVSQLPGWVVTDHFDIQARVPGDPTKDQVRQMMKALLAERFKLAMHTEVRQVPALALLQVKPGKLGPGFRPHVEQPPCDSVPFATNVQLVGPFPALCGGLLGLPPSVPSRQNLGARGVTMAFVANSITAMGNLDRPVFDKTGLTGTFDFALEWEPEPNPNQPPAADPSDRSGPAFLDALQQQLGFKLDSQKGPVDVLILDHVEHPSEN